MSCQFYWHCARCALGPSGAFRKNASHFENLAIVGTLVSFGILDSSVLNFDEFVFRHMGDLLLQP